MKKIFAFFLIFQLLLVATVSAADPLRVFIRGGKKSHGPGAHEHERFLGDWTKLLSDRGMAVSGAMDFPTAEQLAQADVLVMYAQEGGDVPDDKRPGLEAFLKRGGGVVVIHTASVPRNMPGSADYLKSVIGGSWVWGQTKWLEGPMSLYYVDRTHPITTGVANFDMDDEIYYDLDLDPNIRVLAAAYTPNTHNARRQDKRGLPAQGKVTVYDIQPQMWTFENSREGGQPYRAFVCIPGHLYKNFSLPHFRAVLLRGIAWAGKRANIDQFATAEELDSLLYPEGGPSRPDQSLAQLEVHPEFRVSLVATEPLINKPMNIDWDEQGRLWVAETPEYPDGRYANAPSDLVQRWTEGKFNPETRRYVRPAYDKISILTDTTGDGVMDTKQIFYEGLELVTSFVFHKDGVIVGQAPDILFLRDTNGDGKADTVETLYTGLGTGDTHAVINNLRWGYDGWIYATHGYSGSQNVTSGDRSRRFPTIGSGVIRFKPDGSAIEMYSSKGGNTWGLQVAWDNEVFWTQPTSGDLLMHVIMSEADLSRARVSGLRSYRVVSRSLPVFPLIPYDQLPYVQIDQVGRFTAAAGTVIYDGGTWPAKWNYNYFTTEPTINIVHHQIVNEQGVSYSANREPGRESIEFIAGKDMWFRPIEVRVGPDGAVYMIDFYNQAVIHNDTRGPKHGPRNAAIRPDRDHYYGRIWRIDHRQARDLSIPNLAIASPADMVEALEHPNQHVRMNASRLLVERNPIQEIPAMKQLLLSRKPSQGRVAALWTLARLQQLDPQTLAAAAGDSDAAIRKNAMMAAAEFALDARSAALKLAGDPNPRVQLHALQALAALPVDAATARALVAIYPRFEDAHLRAAFQIAANQAPAEFLAAAMSAADQTALAPLVSQLSTRFIEGGEGADPAKLVIGLAGQPPAMNHLKQAILTSIASAARSAEPEWSPELQTALQTLLASDDAGVSAAALPIAVRWDKKQTLKSEVSREVTKLSARLKNASLEDPARAVAGKTLLFVRQIDPAIIPAVAVVLGESSTALQLRLVEALGSWPDRDIGAAILNALPRLSPEAQSAAFNELLKRASWSAALLDALDTKRLDFDLVGPANAHRLRSHPDAAVAERAKAVIEKLRGPEIKEKDTLIASFLPIVEQPGNVSRGKDLYVVNCANCHQFGDIGQRVGPPLDGMGAHSSTDLLLHILDPNRELEFSFTGWSIETKDGEIYDGVITRENATMIALRNAGGETEIQKDQIVSRRNSGRSLMPEGLEALGAEALRDIIAFMRSGEGRFRMIDLAPALTADSRKGMYRSAQAASERLHLTKRGVIQAHGIPFRIAEHDAHPQGFDVMVLKGGSGPGSFSMSFPQTTEVKLGFAARQLHFLGGIAGWGFPATTDKLPAMKITVHYAGGTTEEFLAHNGVEFADYNKIVKVPGSRLVEGFTQRDQLRLFSRTLKGTGVIEKLVFESFANRIAPTTVAITADLDEAPEAASPQPERSAPSAVTPAKVQPTTPASPATQPATSQTQATSQAPLVDLQATQLTMGELQAWTNAGRYRGVFTNSSTLPSMVDEVQGRRAVVFSGSNWLTSDFSAPLSLSGSNAFTLAVWVLNPDLRNKETIVSWASRPVNSAEFSYGSGRGRSEGAFTSFGPGNTGFDGTVPPPGQWHHIVYTYAGGPNGAFRIYVNGELTTERTFFLRTKPGDLIRIGTAWDLRAQAAWTPFSGALAEVKIYDRELSYVEVRNALNHFAAFDPSPANRAQADKLSGPLQWRLGNTNAAQALLFFADERVKIEQPSANSPSLKATLPAAQTEWGPLSVEPGRTYFWRVAQADSRGAITEPGEFWTFTVSTGPATEPLPRHQLGAAKKQLGELRWTPGQFASAQTVWFGSDHDAVAAGTIPPIAKLDGKTGTATIPSRLEHAKTYYWRVATQNGNFLPDLGQVWMFRVEDEPRRNDVTFFVSSDTHYGIPENHPLNKQTIDLMNSAPGRPLPEKFGRGFVGSPRGVVLNGDLLERGFDKGAEEHWAEFVRDFGLTGTEGRLAFPVYEGFGNHDGNPTQGYPRRAIRERNANRVGLTMISTNGLHYSWDWDHVHLVQLNLFGGDGPADVMNVSGPNHDPEGALTFLKQTLAKNAGHSGRPVIVFQHFSWIGGMSDWWTPEAKDRFYDAVKDYNIAALINGHSHGTSFIQWKGLQTMHNGAMSRPESGGGDFLIVRVTEDEISAIHLRPEGWGVSLKRKVPGVAPRWPRRH